MLILHGSNIRKEYMSKEIFDIKDIKIYSNDRIGIVGKNGAGKTTLLKILAGNLKPDRGMVDIKCNISHITQLEDVNTNHLNGEMKKKLKIKDLDMAYLSGGEKKRFKIAEALSKDSHIIFADEPTANLDLNGIKFLKENLKDYDGALLLISHDRDFLNALCNKIFELEDGKLTVYKGNYEDYKQAKEEEYRKELEEYNGYVKEKQKMEELKTKLINENNHLQKKSKKVPPPAKHYKRSDGAIMQKRHNKIKSIEKRFEMKENKSKPQIDTKINLEFNPTEINSQILVEGDNINKSYGKKVIFKNTRFQIENGKKIALIGENGCGKTTLLKMIINKEKGISTSRDLKIAYFSQDFSELDEEKTILENITNGDKSLYKQGRNILGSLLIRDNDVYKDVKVLSGGERVKVLFAKIFLQKTNLIILDEPTNYLDIPSLEVLEETLKLYNHTVIFVSHDKQFLSNVATEIMEVKNKKIIQYPGTYKEYLHHKSIDKESDKKQIREKIMVLENKLNGVMTALCYRKDEETKQQLDEEYHTLLKELKMLRSQVM